MCILLVFGVIPFLSLLLLALYSEIMSIAASQLRALRLRSSYIGISHILRPRAVGKCSPVAPRHFSARACLRQEPKLPAFLEAYKKAGM